MRLFLSICAPFYDWSGSIILKNNFAPLKSLKNACKELAVNLLNSAF